MFRALLPSLFFLLPLALSLIVTARLIAAGGAPAAMQPLAHKAPRRHISRRR